MKTILISCFALICTFTFAQQHATAHTKCQLSVEELLREQSFDIDAPISEKARYVFFDIYKELNLIYQTDENDPKLAEHIHNFNIAVKNANALNLKLTMFQEDIDYVSNLNE